MRFGKFETWFTINGCFFFSFLPSLSGLYRFPLPMLMKAVHGFLGAVYGFSDSSCVAASRASYKHQYHQYSWIQNKKNSGIS